MCHFRTMDSDNSIIVRLLCYDFEAEKLCPQSQYDESGHISRSIWKVYHCDGSRQCTTLVDASTSGLSVGRHNKYEFSSHVLAPIN